MHGEAIASFERVTQWSGNAAASAALAAALARAGDSDRSRAILADLARLSSQRHLASPLVALIFFALGDMDRGFEWLERGFNERSYWMTFLNVDPMYDSLRYHPRFRRLLRLMSCGPTALGSVA